MPHVEGRSAFVVSLDLEQAWGREAHRIGRRDTAAYIGVREAVPRMLDLAERYGVGITWATVGLLFFGCRDEMLEALPERRPRYAAPELCAYSRMNALGADERSDPLHYGRALIERIRDCPRQEIAGHTFAHYYALEDGGDGDAFAADLAAAGAAAATLGITLRSLVFPRNQVNPAYLPICRDAGYRVFRGPQRSRFHRSRARSAEPRWERALRKAGSYAPSFLPGTPNRPTAHDGMIDVAASRFLRPASARLHMLDRLQIASIRSDMRRAAQARSVFHLWWHPHNFGLDIAENLALLEEIFRHFQRLAGDHGMYSATMAEFEDAA